MSKTVSPRQLDQREERSTTPRRRFANRRRLQRVEAGRRTSSIQVELTGRVRVAVVEGDLGVDYPYQRGLVGAPGGSRQSCRDCNYLAHITQRSRRSHRGSPGRVSW